MRRLGAHVAAALDVDGMTTEVVFRENLIEELIGEIEDATTV
jgi:Mg2+/Co2+ transporter CorB